YQDDGYGSARSQRFKRLGKLVTPETKGLFLYTFYQAKELVTSPSNFFRTLPPPGNIAEPAIFLLIMTITGGLLAGITRANLLITIGFVVANLIGATFSAFAMWKLYVMSGSQRSFEENFRVVAYSQVTLLLAALQAPILGVITGLLAFIGTVYIQIQGMTQIHDLPRNKIIAILIGVSLFLAIVHVKLGM
ncbi:MAG: YIP1 family protein, partial [Chloroflexi bacterium]|nr:YIP1 family protein [Chloroflexota bacterium]